MEEFTRRTHLPVAVLAMSAEGKPTIQCKIFNYIHHLVEYDIQLFFLDHLKVLAIGSHFVHPSP